MRNNRFNEHSLLTRLLMSAESNTFKSLNSRFNTFIMTFKIINPESLGFPRGYSNGILAPPGNGLLFMSGQVGWDEQQQIVSSDFVEQFHQALTNIVTIVNEAGGTPERIARLVIYVTDIAEYKNRTSEIGERYRTLMGRHFPAMVLVEVKSLLDPKAMVEIEGFAVV